VGFEPTVLSHTAFRERHLQPLGHLSARENTRAAELEREALNRVARPFVGPNTATIRWAGRRGMSNEPTASKRPVLRILRKRARAAYSRTGESLSADRSLSTGPAWANSSSASSQRMPLTTLIFRASRGFWAS
jgi:hypothetical protein